MGIATGYAAYPFMTGYLKKVGNMRPIDFKKGEKGEKLEIGEHGYEWRFEGMDARGREVEGIVKGNSKSNAVAKVKERGLFPTKVEPNI